jgi:transcriptional regulator with XRE-family HTH domain
LGCSQSWINIPTFSGISQRLSSSFVGILTMASKHASKPLETLVNRLKPVLEKHGAKGRFCEFTGYSREGVDHWLKLKAEPSLAALEKISAFLNLEPWQAIHDDPHPPVPFIRYTEEVQKLKDENAKLKEEVEALTLALKRVSASVGIDPRLAPLIAAATKLQDNRLGDLTRDARILAGLEDVDQPQLSNKLKS